MHIIQEMAERNGVQIFAYKGRLTQEECLALKLDSVVEILPMLVEWAQELADEGRQDSIASLNNALDYTQMDQLGRRVVLYWSRIRYEQPSIEPDTCPVDD